MKKIIAILSLFIVFSCQNETVQLIPVTVKQSLDGMSAEKVGQLHNEILDFMNKNLVPSDNIEKLTEQEIKLFIQFADNNNFQFDKKDIVKAVTVTNNRYQLYKSRAARTLGIVDGIRADLKILVESQVLSEKENQIIEKVLILVEKTDESGDYSNFMTEIDKIKIIWSNSLFDSTKGEGRSSAYLLSVAESSFNYWSINPNGRVKESLVVPMWVGLDAIGALAGAGSSLWSQRNNAKTDWWEVGGQTVIWGAAGSIPGTKGFSKIFK